MKIVKPRYAVSGFGASSFPDLPELLHLGEQWVPDTHAIPPHAHAAWEIYLQLDGWSVWKDSRGVERRCNAGGLYIAPPGCEHSLARTSRGKHHFYFVVINVDAVVGNRLPSLRLYWRKRDFICVRSAQACADSFRQLVRETTTDRPFQVAGMRTAIDRLIVDVTRLHAAPGRPARSLLPAHPAIEAVLNALDNSPAENWRLPQLGRLAGLSPNHLVGVFKSATGQTPHQYLLRRRVALATEMLRNTDATVTTIAYELGFSSSQHFARVFRQQTKKTATAVRGR